MNWALVVNTVVTLSCLFNVGVTAYTSVSASQTPLEQVQFFLTPNEAQKDIGPAGGAIRLQNGSVTGIQPGALTSEVNVEFGIEKDPSHFYPSAFDDYWPGNENLISQIGDPVTLKLPKSAVDFDQRVLFAFILSTPRADSSCSVSNDGCGVEVRIKLKDGTFAYYLDQFQEPDRGFFITGATLRTLADELPAELEIQLNPIDWSSWVPSVPQTSSSQGIRTQSVGEFGETLGLFHLGSNYDHSSFEAACRFPQTMPVQQATAADVPEDKTPLILIHGYQAAGNTFDSAFSDLLGSPKNYNVPLCGWKDAVELFADKENLSLAQTSLREEYELFTFGYDSRVPFANTRDSLTSALEIFAGREIVIAAYSMGGVLAKDYIQTDAKDDNVTVKRLIGLAAPFMGTAAVVCMEQVGPSCVDAQVNPYVSRVVIENLPGLNLVLNAILPTVMSYQGTRDSSYQLPIELDLVIKFRMGEIGAVTVKTIKGRTKPNPYLARLNGWTASCDAQGNCTSEPGPQTGEVAYFNSVTTSITGTSGVLGDASAVGTYLEPRQESDELATLQSACISPVVDDCSRSPLDAVIVIPELNHWNVNKAAVMPAFVGELLRIADKLPDTDSIPNNN